MDNGQLTMDNEFQIDNWQLKIENYLIVVFALWNLQIPIYGAVCTFITRMHFRQMHKPSSLFVGNGLVPFRLQALSLSASNFSLSNCLKFAQATVRIRSADHWSAKMALSAMWIIIFVGRDFQVRAFLWWGRCRRRKERKTENLYYLT